MSYLIPPIFVKYTIAKLYVNESRGLMIFTLLKVGIDKSFEIVVSLEQVI